MTRIRLGNNTEASNITSQADVRKLQEASLKLIESQRLTYGEEEIRIKHERSLSKKTIILGGVAITAFSTLVSVAAVIALQGGEASQSISDSDGQGLKARALDIISGNDHKADVLLPFALPSRDGQEIVDPFKMTIDDRTATKYFADRNIVGLTVQTEAVAMDNYESTKISLQTAPSDLKPQAVYMAFQQANNQKDCADLSQNMMDTVRANPDKFTDFGNGFTPSEYRKSEPATIHHRTDYEPFSNIPMPDTLTGEPMKFVLFYDGEVPLVCPGES